MSVFNVNIYIKDTSFITHELYFGFFQTEGNIYIYI